MYRLKPVFFSAYLIASSLILGFIVAAPLYAQAVTHSYVTDSSLQRGMIVRIAEKDKTKVEPLSEKFPTKMEGVIVAANDSPVTLSNSDTTKQQVFVATTGRYNVLVSNQNGVIKEKDYITISSLDGIGTKAGTKEPIVVGKALAGFDGKTSVSGTTTLKDSAGNQITVAIGLIPVDISISHNPLEKSPESRIPGVGFLQSGAKVLVNKTVDPARLYISVVILIVVAIISGSILFSGVRNSLVSIGRNPLAKKSIVRGLIQVVLVAIIFFTIGLFGVYLLLKL